METLQTLPANYHPHAEFTMKDNRRLVIMNIAGLFLVVIFGWLFSAAAFWLRPAEAASALVFNLTGAGGLWGVAVVLIITIATITLHEAVHGLTFIFISRARPVFGFRWVYAFAAAPGYYIPRNRYLPVALAPLVVISVLGVALMTVVPANWLIGIILMCVVNASGSIGDLWVSWMLLRLPDGVLAHDQGETITFYVPG